MAKKILKYTYYLAVFLMVAVLTAFVNHRHENLPISSMKIEILDKDSANFIDDKLIEKRIVSTFDSLFVIPRDSINLVEIEHSLEKLNQVKNAEIYLDINGELRVDVTQLKPVARIFTDNTSFYLDENGSKMALSKKYSKAVPLVVGQVDKSDYEDVFNLVSFIRSNDILNEQIVSIELDKYNNYSFRTRKGNQIIEIGKPVDVEEKFEKLLIFYRRTVSEFGWQRYKRINLEFANQVVCTKR